MLKHQKEARGRLGATRPAFLKILLTVFLIFVTSGCAARNVLKGQDQTRLEENLRGRVALFWDSMRWGLFEQSSNYVDQPALWQPAVERFTQSQKDVKFMDWALLSVNVQEVEEGGMVGQVIVRFENLTMYDQKVHTGTVSQKWEKKGTEWKLLVESVPLDSYFVGYPATP